MTDFNDADIAVLRGVEDRLNDFSASLLVLADETPQLRAKLAGIRNQLELAQIRVEVSINQCRDGS